MSHREGRGMRNYPSSCTTLISILPTKTCVSSQKEPEQRIICIQNATVSCCVCLTFMFPKCLTLGSRGMDSEMMPCVQGVYWRVLLGVDPIRKWGRQDWTGEETSTMWLQLKFSSVPNVAMELRGPFTVVLKWNKNRSFSCISQFRAMHHPLRIDTSLGETFPFSGGLCSVQDVVRLCQQPIYPQEGAGAQAMLHSQKGDVTRSAFPI